MLIGKALNLGDALARGLPLDSQAAAQLVAKVGLIDVGGGGRMVIDRGVIEARPATFGAGRVGDEDVGVELGVAVA